MRGWLVQQLVKLAIASVAEEDVLVHADSDVVLMRPFQELAVTDAGGSRPAVRMPGSDRREPCRARSLASNGRNSCSASGLVPMPLPDYVGGLIPWKRQNAVALLEEIEDPLGS